MCVYVYKSQAHLVCVDHSMLLKLLIAQQISQTAMTWVSYFCLLFWQFYQFPLQGGKLGEQARGKLCL